jgi:4-amino-4-deoxychorismate lyase
VLIDGEPRDSVDANDRGLHYGDGLFETVAVRDAGPLLWAEHMQRLDEGCRRLGMAAPDPETLGREAARAIGDRRRGVLKIILTRGAGGRGYRPAANAVCTRIFAFYPEPDHEPGNWRQGVQVRLCRTRLGLNPSLAGMKHLNRLEQVLARAEWNDESVAEGLMLDPAGNLVEGTMSNLFLVVGGGLLTPALEHAGVAGVMRRKVLEIADELGIPREIGQVSLERLEQADALFLTNSLIGIWPVRRLEQRRLAIEAIPVRLRELVAPHALAPAPGHG